MDILRVVVGYEIDSEKDFMFSSFAAFILQEKCALFAERYSAGSIFEMDISPVVRGMRMVIYREEARDWRKKHGRAVDVLRDWDKQFTIGAILETTKTAVEWMLEIVSFL